ncbi:hypothetical protein L7F22_002413 [Adiantum nelumboides]|nr:hypothetical protein [Adiantum nelumboides]
MGIPLKMKFLIQSYGPILSLGRAFVASLPWRAYRLPRRRATPPVTEPASHLTGSRVEGDSVSPPLVLSLSAKWRGRLSSARGSAPRPPSAPRIPFLCLAPRAPFLCLAMVEGHGLCSPCAPPSLAWLGWKDTDWAALCAPFSLFSVMAGEWAGQPLCTPFSLFSVMAANSAYKCKTVWTAHSFL